MLKKLSESIQVSRALFCPLADRRPSRVEKEDSARGDDSFS